MTKRERTSSTPSSLIVGRCAMSTMSSVVSRRPLFDAASSWPAPREPAGDRRATVCCWVLLGVELDDQLLLHLSVDDLANRQRVHEHPQSTRHNFEPRRCRLFASHCARNHERIEFARLLGDLDDVALGNAVARDVDPVPVDQEVAVAHELTRLVTTGCESRTVDDVVETALEDAQQVLAGTARLAARLFVIATELLFEDAVNARALLLLTHLQQVLAVLSATATVLARRVRTDFDRALRRVALSALEEELGLLPAASLAVGAGVPGHGQTLRRFGGRHPLWGTGVTSWIEPTSRPTACKERIAVSRPEPGPFTKTSTLRMPCSCARRPADSAAICAAKGVDLREPLKPTWPARAG